MNGISLDCLVGCLRCQRACPYDQKRLRTEPLPVGFTPAETRAVLGDRCDVASAEAAARAARKLEVLNLAEYGPALGRNLGRLLWQQGTRERD